MGRNCLEDLNHACSKLEAELLELRNIKAEVDYKDLGIDDGAAGREEDQLMAGAVMKAMVHPGKGTDTPPSGSLVYLHVTIMKECDQGDEILFTTRKDTGGFGEPCLYILEKGKCRPLRGIEITLMSMTVGERNIIVMKSEMCLMHSEVDNSSMAQQIICHKPTIDAGLTYKADVELVDWKPPHVDCIQSHGKDYIFKYILCEGIGWETPREPFTICVKVCGRSVTYQNCGVSDVLLPETIITCEVGDGTLPRELESGICTMRKEEQAVILMPLMSIHPMIPNGQVHKKDGDLKALQINYMEFEVTLIDMTQARDLMGDGRTIKKILKKGIGEFPIDCPMEDTNITMKAKIRTKGGSEWYPFLADSLDKKYNGLTGMGEIPDVVDAALRVMLEKEVCLLTTVVDEKLISFFPDDQALIISKGQSVEIEIELISFRKALPVAALPPEEKLERAKQMKQEGNELYRKDRISLAKSKYNKAITCVAKAYEFSEEDLEVATEIKVSCMLNMAACAQKNCAYGEAISWCEKVLGEYPDNTKAYYRRSKARQCMALFREAMEDLETIIEIDPALKDEILREKAMLLKVAKKASEKQKNDFGRFFNSRNQ